MPPRATLVVLLLATLCATAATLLDFTSPSYYGQTESRVLDAIARSWDPVSARDVSTQIRLPVTSVSTQLVRLAERGYVEEVDA